MQPRVNAVRSRRQRSAFIDLPRRLYRGDSCWAPPLEDNELTKHSVRHRDAERYKEYRIYEKTLA